MRLCWRPLVAPVVSLALASIAGVSEPAVSAAAGSSLPGAGPAGSDIRTDEVCFAVHNEGDPVASSVHAVRYYDRVPGPDTKIIILIHGTAGPPASFVETPTTTNWFWDPRPDFSVARNLARAGYLVIAYDRLGYGKSPYLRPEGAGWTLSFSGARAMLHEIVTQVRAGAYTASADGRCTTSAGPPVGPRAPAVVIVGWSSGGAIASGYPGIYRDVAAVVQSGWNNQGVPADVLAYWTTVFGPEYAKGDDYVRLVPDEASCTKLAIYAPGVHPSLRHTFCRDGFGPAPAGDTATVGRAVAENLAAIKRVGPGVPVLLAGSDHDVLFPPENSAKELAYWSANCGCDVESWTQTDSGHAFVADASMPTFTAKVVSWLASKGLAGREPSGRAQPTSDADSSTNLDRRGASWSTNRATQPS